MCWWLGIPVAIERYVPRQVAKELYVIGYVCIEKGPAGLGQGWERRAGYSKISFFELEELHIDTHHGGGDVLSAGRAGGRGISCILPTKTGEHGYGCLIGVLQITPDTSTDVGLKLDVLCRALQEVGHARVIPIVPAQQAKSIQP